MQDHDFNDRLIHVLLCEEIGGEAAPDLAPRIIARAFPRRKAPWRIAAAAAVAATLALAAWAVLHRQPAGYPPPSVTGSCEIAGANEPARGAVLKANEAVVLSLGGYCRVVMAPGSVLMIEGEPRAEQVFLQRGEVTCEVDRAVGAFGVRTEAGAVSVTGTRFIVRLIEPKGDVEMSGKQMFVSVMVGAVLMSGAWGTAVLSAGEEATLPEGGVVTGIFCESGKDVVAVKVEGDTKATLYVFGEALAEAVKKVQVHYYSLVKVTWKPDGERRALVAIQGLDAEKEGEVTGKIVAKAGGRWMDVKPEAGPTERYTPRWIGGKDGGLDKEMLAKMAERRVGDKVKVKWTYDEHKRVVELTLLEAAGAEKPAEGKAEAPKEE